MIRLDKWFTLLARARARSWPSSECEGGLCFRLIATAGLTLLINIFPINANANYGLDREKRDWALVAMNHLGDVWETGCWVELIHRESRFNPNARNGSHYGLAQMRNSKVATLKPRAQVRWHMRYLDHRYSGSACKALQHLKDRGFH